MITKLLKYQDEAVESLLSRINKFLEKEGQKSVVLQSPTGSGKTIMTAELLGRLVNKREDGKVFSFIWAAPRKLHLQSKEKLERYYESSRLLECLNVDDLSEIKIGESEILFLNWESINKKGNVFVNENERDFNLTSVVNNTLEEGREIILVIDESHHTSKATNTRSLIEIMKPKITIEVSATPPDISSDYKEVVEFKDVAETGIVKKEVSINSGLKEDKLEGVGSDEFILKAALEKRKELKDLLEKSGVRDVNPLLLIQLPDKDRHTTEDNRKEKMIEELMARKFNVTRENGKLAFYLSEDKENLENITKNNNEVEVLMFKQAIALGWDCRRAYILVLFREWHSETFKMQTVGRIMRMPELKHYKSDALNKGYVYTNIANTKINIEEEVARDIYTIYSSARNYGDDINLLSYHLKRDRGETRLDVSFFSIFPEECKKFRLKEKIESIKGGVLDHIPIDGVLHLENYKTANEPVILLKNISLAKNTIELESALKYFIDSVMLEGAFMFPERRTVERINKCIYNFFAEELDKHIEKDEKEIIATVLSPENRQAFTDIINLSLKEYTRIHSTKSNELLENEKLWNIPEILELNSNHQERKPRAKKSAMVPFYESTLQARHWETEIKFIQFLEDSSKVEWWFKNGERDATFFAVPYKDSSNEYQTFYVDFIVKMKDGRIGLFDTKSGWTAEAQKAGPKSNGLQKYIAEQNKNGKKFFGSIVVPKGKSFWIYNKMPYVYDKELAGWSVLEF